MNELSLIVCMFCTTPRIQANLVHGRMDELQMLLKHIHLPTKEICKFPTLGITQKHKNRKYEIISITFSVDY